MIWKVMYLYKCISLHLGSRWMNPHLVNPFDQLNEIQSSLFPKLLAVQNCVYVGSWCSFSICTLPPPLAGCAPPDVLCTSSASSLFSDARISIKAHWHPAPCRALKGTSNHRPQIPGHHPCLWRCVCAMCDAATPSSFSTVVCSTGAGPVGWIKHFGCLAGTDKTQVPKELESSEELQ